MLDCDNADNVDGQDLNELYERTAWKLEATSGPATAYDMFKLAIT